MCIIIGARLRSRAGVRKSIGSLTIPRGLLLFLPLWSILVSGVVTGSELPRDLADMSLEELMSVEVTTVSRKPERLSDAAAAVYVVTREEIRRSGATNIPDALRLVPGVQVSRISSGKWAVSARGFADEYSNKILVLNDGRSIYSPIFGGVDWDAQDLVLDDIERIEVIRGPGASLWGANAVNGVINIITRHTENTQGVLIAGGAGNVEQGFGTFRIGRSYNGNTTYRVYGKYYDRNGLVTLPGEESPDTWDFLHGGFRLDHQTVGGHRFMFVGTVHEGASGQKMGLSSLAPPYTEVVTGQSKMRGGNLLLRWSSISLSGTEAAFQLSLDRAEKKDLYIQQTLNTVDFDFQHSLTPVGRHQLMWGLGYRLAEDETEGSFTMSFDPPSQSTRLASAFIQDDMRFYSDHLLVTAGTKFEDNAYTGFEVLPSVRLALKALGDRTIWAAVSRAVRTPSRRENDLRYNYQVEPGPGGFATVIAATGNRDLRAEELMAYEAGYRYQLDNGRVVDIAAFYNDYKNLMTEKIGDPVFEKNPLPEHVVVPVYAENSMDGTAYGAEIWTSWQAASWCRLFAGYSYLHMNMYRGSTEVDSLSQAVDEGYPTYEIKLRSYCDLPLSLEGDVLFWYVDNFAGGAVPSYERMDVHLGWHPSQSLELSLVVQNLLNDKHREFTSNWLREAAEVERSAYAKVTWRF